MSVGLTLNSTQEIGEGYKIWITLVFLSTFAGIIMSGIWVFKYGATTENIETGNIVNTIENQGLIIAGSVLTAVGTLIMIFTINKLHSKKDNEKSIIRKRTGKLFG